MGGWKGPTDDLDAMRKARVSHPPKCLPVPRSMRWVSGTIRSLLMGPSAQLFWSTLLVGPGETPTPTLSPLVYLYVHRSSPNLRTSTLKVEAESTKETPTSPTSAWCNYPRTELLQVLILYFDKKFISFMLAKRG
jgi:hypothetical protein